MVETQLGEEPGYQDSVKKVKCIEKNSNVEKKLNKNKTKLEPKSSSVRKRLQTESLQMENALSTEEVNFNIVTIGKNKKSKQDNEKRLFIDKNSITGLYDCQLCSHGANTIKKLIEHCQQQHAGETYHCLEEGCEFQTVDYCGLRTHYYNKPSNK